jgi:transposase
VAELAVLARPPAHWVCDPGVYGPQHAELAGTGVAMISPHHPRRKRKTQDLRKLRRYRRRWHVERHFAWMMRCRRLVNRYECKAENFLGFVQLACIVIRSRR